MWKNFGIALAVVIMMWGCATKKVDHGADGNELKVKGGVPEWVYAPNEACQEDEYLCASSEGSSLEAADLNAKKSLASIFESNIKSHFQIYTTAFSQQRRSELTEQVMSEVQESLDLVLQAVEVDKRYQGEGVFYSLVKLDRHKAKKTLQQQIKDIDSQMDHLYQENAKINITKLLILLDKRQMLNERLIIVAGKGIPTPYTYSKITDLRYAQGPGKVKIDYSENFPESMQKWFEGLLGNSGYQVVEGAPNYRIYMKLLAKPEYLNVPGFQKFTFVAQVTSKDNVGKQLGSFEVSLTVSGRNEEDAFLRIKNDMQKQISEKINNLNLQ